jgi:hypothetical protein
MRDAKRKRAVGARPYPQPVIGLARHAHMARVYD